MNVFILSPHDDKEGNVLCVRILNLYCQLQGGSKSAVSVRDRSSSFMYEWEKYTRTGIQTGACGEYMYTCLQCVPRLLLLVLVVMAVVMVGLTSPTLKHSPTAISLVIYCLF